MTEPLEPTSELEPTTEAVPTAAVEGLPAAGAINTPVASPARRRLRWAIAAVATAVVVAGSALGVGVLSGAKSTSAVLPWAPADAILYAEVRADMPGDQRANLLAFLSKFPGFADQTSFDAKGDDGLDRLIKRMTDGKHDFSTEIKPWFSGQLGVSIEGTDPTAPGVLVVGSISDPVKAAAWLTSIAPVDATHATVAGVALTEFTSSGSKVTAAWGLDGSVLLAGTVDSVKAAITRGPSNDLAGNAGFKAASAALGGDDLGNLYIDLKSYLKLVTDAETKMLSQIGNSMGGSAPSMPAMPTFNTALLPGWTAMRVRAEADHLVLDDALPAVAGQPAQANRTSTIAGHLPASTIGQYELHDVGSLVQRLLTQLEAQPGGPTAAQVDAIAKYVGGVDKAVGWLGDTDLVVVHDGTTFSAGVVAQTSDATASANLFAELKNLASLGGSQAGITVRTESYDDQTITVFDVNMDANASMPPGGSMPARQVSIAFAQTKDLVIVGIGDGFVKAVLDTKAGSSLADQPTYQRAINLAGSSNAGQGFIDLTAVRAAAESMAAGSSDLKAYDSNVKPFLEPIQSIAWSQTVGSDITTARVVLVLK
jgi:Protein of unknown function (DUF3352)